jgi:ELWxxDGT repeat protein
VFWGSDGVHGEEPWVTDGTAAGTQMIVNLAEDLEGSIHGRVYDRDTGAPVAGAKVEYRDVACGMSGCGNVVTDADGRYTIELVREKTWLTVTVPGYLFFQTSTFVGAKASVELDIPLVLGGRVAGRVTRRDGTPITRNGVQFAESLLGKHIGSADLQSNGTYVSPLMDPKVPLIAFINLTYMGYSLSIFGAPSCAAGCDASTPYTAVYPPRGGTLEGVDLVVTEQAKIKGRVLDAATGAPLAGVAIEGWRWWTPDSGFQVRTVSRSDGSYEMALPDAKYWVRASPPSGYAQMWYPDVSCAACIAPPPEATLIVPEPEQVIEHDFKLQRR